MNFTTLFSLLEMTIRSSLENFNFDSIFMLLERGASLLFDWGW